MTIELPGSVEERLRNLAQAQGRDVHALVEEAVQLFLEAAAITDLADGDVAESQEALVKELAEVPKWKDVGAC